ncbi:cinnamoyl-CoA reductase 2-like [Cornus florida]|uniref:cinnamoyl-CoA reductase 2-like n=1 Tax=Cornus florida TaxID=4283 RepID=UPI00289BC38B|nr:cinnamoyl-CoA reductase 2-like [Cornus florida]
MPCHQSDVEPQLLPNNFFLGVDHMSTCLCLCLWSRHRDDSDAYNTAYVCMLKVITETLHVREREREREREMAQSIERERVCVIGGGGYVASWVVNFLLSKGYMVHATVRDPCDERKNGHLKKLKNASENLQLFKTDLLDYEGLCAAIAGCTGVFHVANLVPSDVPNPGAELLEPAITGMRNAELLEPAITGMRNVLNACLNSKVKKVVFVSSVGAVIFNPNWPEDQAMDENCWTDGEYCKTAELWYWLAKTLAESEALEYARRNEINIVTVCPSSCIGPTLQSTRTASSLNLLPHLKGGKESVEDEDLVFADVRDVADAILLAYEKPEAEGRYICSSHTLRSRVLVEKLKSMYPNYNYPKSFTETKRDIKISSKKLQNLGWKSRPLEETIVDTVKSYEESGLLGNE